MQHISPGCHGCGESGRAMGRVQAFSFVAFKGAGLLFFSRRGGATNPHPFVAKSLSRSLPPGEASKLPRQIQSAQLCTIPSPFTARFQGTLVADDVTTVLVREQ